MYDTYEFIFGASLYILFVYFWHWLASEFSFKELFLVLMQRLKNLLLTIFSYDYVVAGKFKDYFDKNINKNKSDVADEHLSENAKLNEARSNLIKKFNYCNFAISILLMLITFFYINENNKLISLIMAFNGYRFLSRSIEIIIAFGRDVFDKDPPKKNDGRLKKLDRLKLALISYFEIFIYSASFYMTLPLNNCNDSIPTHWKSILTSLSVGSLTNVAYSKENLSKYISDSCIYNPPDWLQSYQFVQLPFIQVFTTLALVVLVLTMYVSRKD